MDKKKQEGFYNAVVIVAHPDDETLWAGGTILMHPEIRWTIITLCRKSDADRASKFQQALKYFNATGAMGDLDDSPEQQPLPERKIQQTILSLAPLGKFDLVVTHSLWGEYTRHLRHEETAKAVLSLRESGDLSAREIWMFAYEDGGGKYLPHAIRGSDQYTKLSDGIWQKKYEIIANVYGFGPESFEAKTTPREEAFWYFKSK
jgi:LmbE family N-acetylglucosaminyl deacetylase